MALPEALRGLMNEGAYPHPCGRIELIETHISWVLLTGDYAYKLKKPVRYSFLDFSTPELRKHFCEEELRCNRAFTPDLYLDVLAVCRRADGSIRMGGETVSVNTVLEWAVKMRQFDPTMQLDRLVQHDAVATELLTEFGRKLAGHHDLLPRLTCYPSELQPRIFGPVTDNFAEIATTGLQALHESLLIRTRELSCALGDSLISLLATRMAGGWIRECHGDLHLSNLALIDGEVAAFDCLEFNPTLRWIDPFSDVAFLFMDCHERGRSDLAYAFLDGYLDVSGDYRGSELLGYFAAYRSMVRAKVAALRWEQEHSEETVTRFVKHVEWAHTWLTRPRGALLLMCGLSGAGKSHVAEQLVPMLPAIRLRSDIARKAMAGLAGSTRTNSPVGGGLYRQSQSDAMFEHIAQVAEALLRGGDNVIIDATFIERQRRAEFIRLAKRLDIKVRVIHCDAPIDVLKARIQARAIAGADASEATLDVLDMQIAKFEPPCAPEPVIKLATGAALSGDALTLLVDTLKQ